MEKVTVKTVDEAGNELDLVVESPRADILQKAALRYNIRVAELLRASASAECALIPRSKLSEYLVKIGAWSDADEKQFIALQFEIRGCEKILAKGGIKKSEARTVALRAREARDALVALYGKRSQYDNATIEAVAEQHRFRVLVTLCVKTPDGKPYFSSVDDYVAKESSKAAFDSASVVAKSVYNVDDNFRSRLPEEQFLVKYGFTNDLGQLINADGKLIDLLGRLVNEAGRLVDADGKLVDSDGNPVDESGSIVAEPLPFLDD
jgi:hypothetical protein